MEILILWHDLPSRYNSSSIPLFNLLRPLSRKNNITLISFQEETEESGYNHDLKQYCEVICPVPIPKKNSLSKLLWGIKNTLSPQNLLSKNRSFFNFYYSPKMQTNVEELLISRDFDLIYTSMRMAHYVQGVNFPKLVHALDSISEATRQIYVSTKNPGTKFLFWLYHLNLKRYEKNMLKKFNTTISVSPYDQTILKSLSPDISILVIPNGVDLEFFKPINDYEDWPSLIFVGDMSHPPNIDAILYFYFQIYGKITKSLPETRLYLVGRNPVKEIRSLSSDRSVIVTGYVEDIRPYLARASVVIAPFISGTGIKNKILEAMAMGKPVISTSFGSRGIDVSPEENIIIADELKEFANSVLELLNNKKLRKRIGVNARRLIEEKYSCEKIADLTNDVFQEVVKEMRKDKPISNK